MTTKLGVAALALIGVAACGGHQAGTLPATQEFTRRVEAAPARVVAATLTTFSRYGIPVREANETSGDVHSMPLDLRGNWGPTPMEDRVNCPGGPDSTTAHITFDAKAKAAGGGSILTLNTQRDGGGRCVIRSSFVTELLDDIAKASQPS
jgi:hypothetical protein